MKVKPLHHVVVSVTDLRRSIAFYTGALGLRVTMEAPVEGYEGYLRLAAGSTGRMAMLAAGEPTSGMIELIQWDVAGGVDATPAKRPGDPGVAMLAFELDGETTLADVRGRLAEQGVAPWSDITPVQLEGYPPFATMLIEDPDGLLVELIQLPTRDEVRAFRKALHSQPAAT